MADARVGFCDNKRVEAESVRVRMEGESASVCVEGESAKGSPHRDESVVEAEEREWRVLGFPNWNSKKIIFLSFKKKIQFSISFRESKF